MAKPHMCDPALLAKDLGGKTYIVTGGNGGIGFECVKQLASQGAHVMIACRRVSAGEEAAQRIRDAHTNASVEVRELDLAQLGSVRAFASGVLESWDRLDGLLNNAGVMNTPQSTTADGFEMQFGTNHLGHYLLTELLWPLLEKSAPSRVVNVSSCYHDKAMGREGEIVLDDLNFQSRKYDGWTAYAQSKLANLLHAKELAKRGGAVQAVSVHPGWVRTDLAKNTMPLWVQNFIARPFFSLMGMIEPWQGAQTSLHCLLSDDIESGAYYSQLGIYRDKSCNKGGWPMRSPNPHAHDDATAAALMKVSEELTGASGI